MPRFSTENIRNIALVGHAGSGKTSLAESLLHRAGAINNPGAVERGSTVCDFTAQEKELQHSLEVSLCSFDHDGNHVNLLDTPGYPDFFGRALSVLPAADSVAVVINASMGAEQISQWMMDAAGERGLCRMLVINRIDANDADLPQLLSQLQQQFGPQCLPLNLPAAEGDAVVDCFFQHREQPTAFSSVEEAHTAMVDQVVEVDEELMALYLEQGEELSPEQLHAPFEQTLREGHLIPVCFVSARTGAGVSELLEIFSRLMPTPLESNPPPFLRGEGSDAKLIKVVPNPDQHVVAHVFKVTIDPYLGRLGLFRIHQGTVFNGIQLFVGDARKPFKVTHLLKLQGKQHKEIGRAVPGDICAIAKVEELHFDAVIHDCHDEDHHHLKSITLPPPMCGLAIEPARHGDEQKLSDALHRLAAEDPSLNIEYRASLNETVLYGAGDLHLRVVLERMKDQFNVEVQTSPPSIAYREAITRGAVGHHRHKKQTGGSGQFGEVKLRVDPLERGQGFEFISKVVGGAIPGQFIPAVEKGVRQAMESGAIAGFPMQDLRVTVLDGKHHSVDSKEIAFVSAGKKAFLDAISKAGAQVLEPIVNVSIVAPSQSVGDVTGDISSKRGMISGTSVQPGSRTEVSAQIPLSALEGYQSHLKSMTGGEGSFTLTLSHYAAVPHKVQQELCEAFRPGSNEEQP